MQGNEICKSFAVLLYFTNNNNNCWAVEGIDFVVFSTLDYPASLVFVWVIDVFDK